MYAIEDSNSKYDHSQYYDITKKAWEFYCKKYDIDFLVVDTPDESILHSKWNKHTIFNNIGDNYDKIGLVDFDTMPNWNAPNIFELYDDEFCGVIDNESIFWLYNSISTYKKTFSELSYSESYNIDKYINSGVLFFTKEHKFIFDEMLNIYKIHKQTFDTWKVPYTGRDQTILNLLLERDDIKQKIKRKYFDVRFNTMRLHQNGWLSHNWQLNEDQTNFFIKYSYIWHFTGCSVENRIELIKQIWNNFKNQYGH